MKITRMLEELCHAADTAFIVYDMQVGIVRQMKNGAEIVGHVKLALDVARAAGMRVFFTRHMSLPKELMGAFQYRTAMTWQKVASPDAVKSIFLRGAPAFEIIPELTPLPSEAIFDKITMSAFEATPLEIALRDCGIRAVVLAGIALEIGIEPTARHAADLALIPILLEDGCGSGSDEARQRSLASLKFAGDTIVTDVATF